MFFVTPLSISPQVYLIAYRYINKLPISSVNSYIKLMVTGIEAQMGIYLKKKY